MNRPRVLKIAVSLVAILSIAAVIGIATVIWQNHNVRAVERALNELGGDSGFGGEAYAFRYSRLHQGKMHFSNADLQRVLDVTRGKVSTLELGGSAVTDEGLRCLAGVHSLRSLDLTGTKVGDAGVAYLQDLPKLNYLCLWGTEVTGATLSHLESLPSLETLNLSSTKVNDRGLEQASKLKQVKNLWLNGAPITMAGLRHLVGWQTASLEEGIKYVYFDDDLLTQKEVRELGRLLPRVFIGSMSGTVVHGRDDGTPAASPDATHPSHDEKEALK